MLIPAFLLISASPVAQAVSQPPADAGRCTIAAQTEVTLAVAENVSSLTGKTGDRFSLTLARPLVLNGKTVLRAGMPGMGEIIWAVRPKYGGRGGELVLAARKLDEGGVTIPLRSFRINAAARQVRNGTIFSLIGKDWGKHITTSDVDVPTGTEAVAKVSADTDVPCSS